MMILYPYLKGPISTTLSINGLLEKWVLIHTHDKGEKVEKEDNRA
jgi:hypothetical protein